MPCGLEVDYVEKINDKIKYNDKEGETKEAFLHRHIVETVPAKFRQRTEDAPVKISLQQRHRKLFHFVARY